MASLLELVTVLALIWTGLSVMVGALPPGEALRRVGVALALLLVIPAFVACFIQTSVKPMLASVVTVLESSAFILLLIGVIALAGWLLVRYLQKAQAGSQNDTER